MQACCRVRIEHLIRNRAEEDVERELGETALGSRSEDCVALYYISICQLLVWMGIDAPFRCQ